jgi:nucleoside-diphosphate-sugar epimerase
MKVLIIGGTGLSGPHLVAELAAAGHDVTVFHRGRTASPDLPPVRTIAGDKADLRAFRDQFAGLGPDVVIHMVALTREDAATFMETFRGIAGRAVVISSADVYLAYGRLHGTESGPLEPVPLTEESPLRTELGPEGEAYDKIGVEALVRDDAQLPVAVVRYPAVYGPGDRQRRFYAYVRRMKDKRPVILAGATEAAFRFSHSYAANAAHAVALVAAEPSTAGKVYNVAEPDTPSIEGRIGRLAAVMGWRGEVLVAPDAEIGGGKAAVDFRQHLTIDSSRIRRELGYAEVVAEDEALRRIVAWLLANPPSDDRTEAEYEHEAAILSARRQASASGHRDAPLQRAARAPAPSGCLPLRPCG